MVVSAEIFIKESQCLCTCKYSTSVRVLQREMSCNKSIFSCCIGESNPLELEVAIEADTRERICGEHRERYEEFQVYHHS